jgi:D-3-phosphoglycerate dehydrogenase (EC 1.1.1.95)
MTTSFDKSKLKILLLEGIHPSAERIFRDAGYTNIESVKTALSGPELIAKLDGVHFLGIRSRTTLTRDALRPQEAGRSRLFLHWYKPS